jgi:RNA polymerase sigma-70 factor, ECF subfamily
MTSAAEAQAAQERAAEGQLLARARGGDEQAFGMLTAAHRAGLRAHCYRMLGSVQDAEDALQEALLRAWRGLAGFQGRSSVRSWLYAIATNAALDITRHRSRRELPVDFAAGQARMARIEPPATDRPWLEPYPDSWLAEDASQSPEARYEQRESIELAFVVALQHLPPLQRAALLLREVVGLSAGEIGSQLGTTPAAVNSALQRARAAVRDRVPARSQQAVLRQLGDARTRALVEQYASALERGDADTLVSMLTKDATWSMPPLPTWFRGHAAIREFLLRYPLTERWLHRPARASGQLAVGCYLISPDGSTYLPAVLDVLTLDGGLIAAVTGFHVHEQLQRLDPSAGAWVGGAGLFAWYGLPASLPKASATSGRSA